VCRDFMGHKGSAVRQWAGNPLLGWGFSLVSTGY
jgi:hypothetical protein